MKNVHVIEHCPIPMKDGRRLSARIWMPAADKPVPAILEYIPYRKRDFTRARDEPMHAYFAKCDYAAVRVDLAGSGDSEGVLADEYVLQEQDDAVEIIEWLSRQPWCSGTVGMIGKSWGGFNCLQIAARQPEALRAIVPVCATDDRYTDDVHFMGGCLLVDGIEWGAVFQAFLPRPPDPEVLGDAWRKTWNQRLERLECPIVEWLKHPHRDSYWKHGSVCESYEKVKAATLLVGGWVDGYKSALMRMAERLSCPVKCIMGPWGHLYPHSGVPGPAIGFLQEAARWFDYWLKGIDNGVMDEPKLRAYLQQSQAPQTHYAVREGRWVGEEEWPSPAITGRVWYMTNSGLSPQKSTLAEQALPYNLAVGQFAGDWGAIALQSELPPDQRYDDALSRYFDSESLTAPLEILGASMLRLEVCSDKPVAMIVARLNDVRPDGSVSKVTMGMLNLTHRAGSEHPENLVVGEWYEVEIHLGAVGYSFPPGHRLRVSLSPSYWPIAWPSPERVSLRIRGNCQLVVPERKRAALERDVQFASAVAAPGPDIVTLRQAREFKREAIFDLVRNTAERRITGGTGGYGASGLCLIRDIGLSIEYTIDRTQKITLDDPNTAITEYVQRITFQRGVWHVAVESRLRLTCTPDSFILNCDLDVFEGDRRLLARSWNPEFPRKSL